MFAVIGCGRFGMSIAKTLYELGNEVLAVDNDPERIKEISSHVTYAVEADATDESVLKELGLSNFDVVIVSIGSSLEASIMATLVVKELGAKKIVAKAISEVQGRLLQKIGADKIVFPERDMGVKLAHNLTSTKILDYIQLLPDFSILEVAALASWVNKSLAELKLRQKNGINIIAIRHGANIELPPRADYIIKEKDILIVAGTVSAVNNIEIKSAD
ncbi:MAG: TrkA family potassium uptake protein [Tissierellia bacterium]|jgi:trk system potassium uptake protein TrkA|nr:TrkA family potassium uptake protein [Tissierellia bacterium]